MKSKITLLMISLLSLIVSCSQSKDMTGAKVTLNLSKIVNLSSGLGSGGAILFAKSSSGEQFAKIINGTEENLELVNGDWSFYAVMWGDPVEKLKGVSYCAKSSQKLSGGSASINLNLNNANCADNDFSAGNIYSLAGKNYFSDLFVEECDELSASGSFTCLRDNQGSGVSYRIAFKGYKKATAGAAPAFTNETIYSSCVKGDGAPSIHTNGLRVNFPSGSQAMPFIASVEIFLGSSDCGVSDLETKGIFVQTFFQGIGAESSASANTKFVKSSIPQCMPYVDTKDRCESMLGSWSSYSCSAVPLAVYAFTPSALCAYGSSIATSAKFIKQFISIPKNILCKNTNYSLSGTDVFPGGMGTTVRPYKICNEWQLNQIGEKNTSSNNLSTYSYKLMNDLDMNITDFNAALRPTCAGVVGGVYGEHSNFNPLDQVTTIGCSPANVKTGSSYTGVFNGNNKTIANLRVNAKGVSTIGFVRRLGQNGEVNNLNFVNLEAHGSAMVGGVAGSTMTNTSSIKNINMKGGEIESDGYYAGSIVGSHADGATVQNVFVKDVDVRGVNYVGGLIGSSLGMVIDSSYRGNIKQEQSMPLGYVGGLVGEGSGGFYLRDSFSEGSIISAAQYVGGIAGAAAGTIINSYSNMAIGSRFTGTNARIGGIVGKVGFGSIQAVYSDSILSYTGGGSGAVVDGIAAEGTISAPSMCMSSSPVPQSNCLFGNLRTGATFLATSGANWKGDIPGILPRLQWEVDKESRPCLLSSNLSSFSIQANLGKGSATKPYSICTAAQLKSTNGSMAGSYYQLEEDIRLSEWSVSNDSIATFGGVLNGKDYALYGLALNSDVGVNHGIFANNTGTISNLKVVGNVILHTAVSGATGILAGVNSGTIKKILLKSNRVEGANYVGGVVGSNTGTIDDVSVDEGIVKGISYVGGITGNNEGIVTRVNSRVNISDIGAAFFKIAGIAGFNGATATIDQAVFSGSMYLNNVSTNSFLYAGGIVGYNLGKVYNTMTKNYSQIQVKNMDMVGGLVGYNGGTGSIKTSLALGKLQYSIGTITPASSFHQTAGFNDGGVIDSNTFFLANNAGGLVGLPTAAGCDATTVSFAGVNPSYLYAGNSTTDLISLMNIMINGDTLVSYSPFSPPTTNYIVDYGGGCVGGDIFNILKSYEPSTTGKKSVADFANMNNFLGFDIAYESWNGSSKNVDRLLEYHKAKMDNRNPTLTPPIWQFEEGDATPRLLQVND